MFGYLYKSFCLALLVLCLIKLIFGDGSWINYFIIFTLGYCIWWAGQYAQTFILKRENHN
jgi:uncharacterized membrane protein YjjP (DUF1212 family)